MGHPRTPVNSKNAISLHSSNLQGPEHLFKILIGQLCAPEIAHGRSHGFSADEPDEVVLDMELDGYRYLVLRTLKSSREPVELSPREKEIVRMVAQGHPNKIIATVLNISSWTVCTHLRRVFAKLGVGSRAAMVARLHDLGTIGSGALQRHPAATGGGPPQRVKKSDTDSAPGLPKGIQKLQWTRGRTA
jgi:DNA-binding CsgD family transcriptional regulator